MRRYTKNVKKEKHETTKKFTPSIVGKMRIGSWQLGKFKPTTEKNEKRSVEKDC